jgi:hypothetical protein
MNRILTGLFTLIMSAAGHAATSAEAPPPPPALSGPVAFLIVIVLFVVVLGGIALFVRWSSGDEGPADSGNDLEHVDPK